jgi:hypothetical protein
LFIAIIKYILKDNGRNEYPCAKECGHLPHTIHQNYSKWILDLHRRGNTLKKTLEKHREG